MCRPQENVNFVTVASFMHVMRAEVLTVMKIQVIFWIEMPCIDVVGYQRFEGSCYLHLQGEDIGNTTDSALPIVEW